MTERQFHIHNITRKIETRILRTVGTGQARGALILGGGLLRVMRGRPVLATESLITRLKSELLQKEKQGFLKVTTPTGVLVDISTLKEIGVRPPTVVRPRFPLDSAQRDRNEGVGEDPPQHWHNAPRKAQLEAPDLIKPFVTPVVEEVAPEVVEEIPETLPPEELLEDIAEVAEPVEPEPEPIVVSPAPACDEGVIFPDDELPKTAPINPAYTKAEERHSRKKNKNRR